ncbi:MAG TPA: response regulator [Pseudomonadota bacterium]|nr:response regulator [Xanthomonadales bacterium]HQW63715.1 response regulator [Pseudomonadota bacterium]MBP6692099.1 response regulator [Xanthomonadales bacterium]MBP7418263.1 response regulator [Xanthomonadales bacterium]HQX24272.1 response regulator [Pseudomonadota bacterium]
MRVLLAEDDTLLGEGIQTALRRALMTVDWVQDGVAALAALRQEPFDAAVMDLGLPRLDGTAVIRDARRAGVRTPILALTARDQVSDRVQGLELGADDYMGKPFDTDELVARIRALHRRSSGQNSIRMEHGALVLDPAAHLATYEGRLLDLPRREFALLQLLLENAGRVVSREAAQQRLYGWNEDRDSNALDVHVHHLRRKTYPGLIRTVRGVGFLVEAPP